MALYSLAKSGGQICNGIAVVTPHAAGTGGSPFIHNESVQAGDSDRVQRMSLTSLQGTTMATTLDGRYKVGGSGSWERPGGPGQPV